SMPPPPVDPAESSPASDAPPSESATEPVVSDAIDSVPLSAPDETPSAGSGSTSEPVAVGSSSPPSATPSKDEAEEEPARPEDAPANQSPEDAPRVVVPAYTPARKAFTPQPSYPAEAREQGEEGTVVLSGRVTAGGDVVDARVVESAGPRLDRVALETFRTWQFQPAERDGVAVESPYRVSFRFALDRRPSPPPPTTGRQPAAPPPPPASSPPPAESAAGTVEDPLPFGGDFEPPQRRVSPLPSLPRGRAGEVGNLVLSVVVDREGRVARIETEQGVDPQVTEQAIDAVKRWRFQPATRDGEPVAVWHRLVLRL
ncbi:MAG: TonB family protein, partial [Acidobacteriota bacterium]